MNMFGMDHMLKDGWSGWYSQGYMYFDNCSSLFLPKVRDQDKCFVLRWTAREQTRLITTLCVSLTSVLFNVFMLCPLTQVYYADFNPYQLLTSPKVSHIDHIDLKTLKASLFICLFVLSVHLNTVFYVLFQSDPSNQSLIWPDKPVRHVVITFNVNAFKCMFLSEEPMKGHGGNLFSELLLLPSQSFLCSSRSGGTVPVSAQSIF